MSIKILFIARAQPGPLYVLHIKITGNITDGVHADLIRSDNGLLLGIRVSWSWLSSDPPECFQSPEVQLSSNIGIAIQRTLDSTSHNNSVEYHNTELDCNQMYLPIVRAINNGIRLFDVPWK